MKLTLALHRGSPVGTWTSTNSSENSHRGSSQCPRPHKTSCSSGLAFTQKRSVRRSFGINWYITLQVYWSNNPHIRNPVPDERRSSHCCEEKIPPPSTGSSRHRNFPRDTSTAMGSTSRSAREKHLQFTYSLTPHTVRNARGSQPLPKPAEFFWLSPHSEVRCAGFLSWKTWQRHCKCCSCGFCIHVAQ